jgi:hypothetical protein
MCESNIVVLCKSKGKEQSKPLASRHGHGMDTAWARHSMCELTLRKIGRNLMRSSHWPQHGVAKVKILGANEETEFKVLTLNDKLESSKVNRQPTGKSEKKFKGQKKN